MFYFADRKLKEPVHPVGNGVPLPKLLGCYRHHVVSSNYKYCQPSSYVISFRTNTNSRLRIVEYVFFVSSLNNSCEFGLLPK
jgi:hypothetical protein